MRGPAGAALNDVNSYASSRIVVGMGQKKLVAVLGASGYTGVELLRLLASHPNLELVAATASSHAGTAVADLQPALAGAYPDLVFGPTEARAAEGADLVFCALPHGASQHLVPQLLENGSHVVDLAADFRLKDAGLYPAWYGEEHSCPELLRGAVYGLPEVDREQLSSPRSWQRRLLPNRGGAGPRTPCRDRLRRTHRDSGRCRQRRVGRGSANSRKRPVLHGRRGFCRLWPNSPPYT